MISTKQILENLAKDQKYNTYIISDKELNEINDKIYIKESMKPTVSTKEYNDYRAYRRRNIKKIMQSYNSDKVRYKKGKLTKEEFMMMYMNDIRKKLNKNNRNNNIHSNKLNNTRNEVNVF